MAQQSFQTSRATFGVSLCAALVLVLLVCRQFFVQPYVGLADNGDFWRTMGYFDLNHTALGYDNQFFSFYNRLYQIKRIPHPQFVTSELIFLQAAVWLNRLTSQPLLFDLRMLASFYLAFLAATVFFLIRAADRWGIAVQIAFAALVVLAFSDVGYAAYLNSFFSEPSTYVFLLAALTSVVYVARKQTIGRLVVCVLMWILFLSAKPQNAPLAVLIAPWFLRLGWISNVRRWRWSCAVASLVVLGATTWYYLSTPQRTIVKPTYYVSVFYGILLNTPTPQQDLKDLGLPEHLAKYASTTPYDPNSPIEAPFFQQDFFDHISFAKIATYYLTHPSRLIHTFDRDADVALSLRPELGNFEKSSGAAPGQKARANALWSETKIKFMPNRFFPLAGWIVAFLAGALYVRFKTSDAAVRLFADTYVMLLVMAALQFVIVAITQSVIDTAKHMFLFNLIFDFCFIVTVSCLVALAVRRVKITA